MVQAAHDARETRWAAFSDSPEIARLNMPPSPPKDHNSEIPGPVNDLVLKCLEKNPADRFQNAADLKLALDSALRQIAPTGLPHLMPPPDKDVDTIH